MSDSPSLSVDLSFDRHLESSSSDSDQSLLIDLAPILGSLLLNAAVHNSYAWPLIDDLTIKVFSMLDTQSLYYAAATCSLFKKSAMERQH
ncbi:hypothetical protein SLEP1_g36900 [Rubroshorea leprosula]|uniref:F-box domain-containing protein n=1 Tax=Rubroshorea leprosula TaxID=152421 RepID=A0AAV5KT76_9ROSI|nr:hypothetical protein SLEP1_g36900 [Rubroshorea leprosula]